MTINPAGSMHDINLVPSKRSKLTIMGDGTCAWKCLENNNVVMLVEAV